MPSPFCRRCPQNLVLKNGYIRYLSNRAFHYCSKGYKIYGQNIRNCLRTSKWSLPVPYCRSMHLFEEYNVLYLSYSIIEFQCHKNSRHSMCTFAEPTKWSDNHVKNEHWRRCKVFV